MKWYLRGKGLLDYVLGTIRLDNDASETERKAFRINDDKAMAAIGLHIEPNQQIHVEDCNNSYEAWASLEQVHQPINRVRIMQLKKELYHIKMKDDETMSSYVARTKIASANLKQAGSEVKDEDLAYVILAGLPDTYENLNMALASLPDDKFTSTEVIRVLLAEYDRRRSRTDNDVSESMEALQTGKGSKGSKSNKAPNVNTMAAKAAVCFNCKKPGHYARNCRSKSGNKQTQHYNKSKRDLDAFLVSLNTLDFEESWILDSGCTHHVCKRKDWFQNFQEIEEETINTAANPEKQKGTQLQAKGTGDIVLKTFVGNKHKAVVLRNVYYVPHVRKNLMSVAQIEKKGKEFIIKDGKVMIRNTMTGQLMCEAHRKNDLYIVRAKVDLKTEAPVEANLTLIKDRDIWHRRFCHVSNSNIEKLATHNKVRGLENTKIDKYVCDACNISKSTKTACKRIKGRQSNNVCELIHSDLCGPMPVKSLNGNRYFITFIDDFSRKTTIMCIKSKDEVTDCVKKYIARVEREKGEKVKRFRTDNGLEYCNKVLTDFFKNTGIKHEKSNVETPQMNGIAERINRTLMDLVRSMLKSAKLPQKFWAEAVVTAAYIRDRVGHTSIKGDVPLAIWTNRTPSVQHLKVYGCLAYANLPKQGRKKLDDRAVKCFLVGYASQTKGYRLWCPERSDVVITKHVQFAEDKIGYEWLYKDSTLHEYRYNNFWAESDSESEPEHATTYRHNKPRATKEELPSEPENDPEDLASEKTSLTRACRTVGEVAESQKRKIGRPKKTVRNPYGRKGKPKPNIDDQSACNTEDSSEMEINLVEVTEPRDLKEALTSPQATEWKRAINEEIESLESQGTWEIVDLPQDKRCIGCKWIFKLKTDSEGKITRFKARLVAQGFSQEKGIDYSETYSPVANFSIIRFMLAITAMFGWHTRHLDIKCAYLNGKLEEELYMSVPPLYKVEEGKVVKLKRPIYGLKQSGRNWNTEIDVFLTKNGFKRLRSSSCVYCKGCWTILVIYVDDIFAFSRKKATLREIIQLIKNEYETRDLGEITYALGVKIQRNELGDIQLSQKAYIESMLSKFGLEECRTTATPLEHGLRMSKEDGPKSPTEIEEMTKVPYRQLIGSLMHLALYTRPDIMYAVTKLSQYNTNPGRIHWAQAKHILRYLSGTKDYALQYRASQGPTIQIYSDADWAGDLDDRHSYSGMVVTMGQNVIHWKSMKQKSITTSSMEAEYVALSLGVREAMWIQMFIAELNMSDLFPQSCELRCDNRAAMDFSKNRIEKGQTKHIDIAHHLVREKLDEGSITLSYIASKDNPADIMTKPLRRIIHREGVQKLKLDVTKVGD